MLRQPVIEHHGPGGICRVIAAPWLRFLAIETVRQRKQDESAKRNCDEHKNQVRTQVAACADKAKWCTRSARLTRAVRHLGLDGVLPWEPSCPCCLFASGELWMQYTNAHYPTAQETLPACSNALPSSLRYFKTDQKSTSPGFCLSSQIRWMVDLLSLNCFVARMIPCFALHPCRML